jgi:hypothetical protein
VLIRIERGWVHSRPQSHFQSVTRWKSGSGLDDQRERSDWLLRDLLFRRSWAIFARKIFSIKICQYKYFVSSEASQFKSMRFRNYYKFFYTSGSVYPTAQRRDIQRGNTRQIVSRRYIQSITRWSRVRILANQRSERVVRIEIHFDVFSQLYLSLFFMKLVEIL